MHPPNQLKSIRVAVCAALGLTALVGCATSPAQFPKDVRGVVSINGERSSANLRDPYERGKAYLMAGQFGLAVRVFRNALQDDPTSVRTLNAIAATYDRMHRFDLAERYYMKALALDSESVQTLNNIGYSYVLQGRADLALAYLQRSLKLARSNETVLGNVAAAQDLLLGPADRRTRSDEIAVAVMREHRSAPKGAIWIERTAARVQTLFTRLAPDASEGAALLSGEEAVGGEVARAVPLVPVQVRDLPPPEAAAQLAQTDAASAEATAEAGVSVALEGRTQGADEALDRPRAEPPADALQVRPGRTPLESASAEPRSNATPGGLFQSVRTEFKGDRSRLAANARDDGSFPEVADSPPATVPPASQVAGLVTTFAALPSDDDGEQMAGLGATRAMQFGLDVGDPGERTTGSGDKFGENVFGGLARWFWDQIGAVFSGLAGAGSDAASSQAPVEDAQGFGAPVLLGAASDGGDAVPAWLRPKGQIDVRTMLASPSLKDHYRQSVDPVRSALEEQAREYSDLAERSVMVALGQPDLAPVATETFVDGGQAVPAGAKAAIEVSNGTGRHDMAARLRLYFQANGIVVGRLTNDESFANAQSVVYYRPGFEDDVEFLVALLPVDVKRRPDKDLATGIRLLLGKDLLPFDRFLTSLFEVGVNATSA